MIGVLVSQTQAVYNLTKTQFPYTLLTKFTIQKTLPLTVEDREQQSQFQAKWEEQ